MAKNAGRILTGIITIACCASLWAQQKGGVKQGSKATPAKDTAGLARKKASRPLVYLGHTDFSGGVITPEEFKAGMKQGISSKDDAGNPLKIIGFTFMYAERRLFEDSAGNLQMMTDFSQEYCPGDTVSTAINNSVFDVVKSGDTVFCSQVLIQRRIGNDIDTIMGKELKCIIRKNKS